jgi:hypothetical protein
VEDGYQDVLEEKSRLYLPSRHWHKVLLTDKWPKGIPMSITANEHGFFKSEHVTWEVIKRLQLNAVASEKIKH